MEVEKKRVAPFVDSRADCRGKSLERRVADQAARRSRARDRNIDLGARFARQIVKRR